MKKYTFSVTAALAMSTLLMAGGGFATVAPAVEPMIEIPEVDNSAFYVGLGYGYHEQSVEEEMENYDETFTRNTVMLQAGYAFNDYLAVEGRYWTGLDDMESDNETLTGDFSTWGIYAKPMYPVTASLKLYALLGYASTNLDFDAGQNIDYLNTDAFSWGIGMDYSLTENLSLFVDYNNLGYTDEFTFNNIEYPTDTVNVAIDSINVGLTYTF